ncbi:MAG: hypothetical protein ACI3XH_08835 [Phascolarctobacterium sp.]
MDTFKELMAVRPVIGRRIRHDGAAESAWLLPIEQLAAGDIVRVMPGERIPSDGVVVKGMSMVSKQAVNRMSPTFEAKAELDKVSAGLLNGTDVLEVRLTSAGCHSSFEQRLEQARAEQDAKGVMERLWSHLSDDFKPSYNH